MITGSAVYHVVEAMAPLYTAAALGYGSVRWLGAFSDAQCAGINHFVALYAAPLLIFHMVATNDPYRMDGRLLAADSLQKVVVLLSLMAWALIRSRFLREKPAASSASSSPLKWVVTNFSVASLPNTIIMGVPLLHGMYGPVSGGLMKQIVVMQFCVWYNVVIFLYEFMAARERGGAKINPAAESSPGASDESGGVPLPAAGRGTRDNEVAVNIEITEVTARESHAVVADETNKELGTGGGGVTNKEGQLSEVPLPVPAPSVAHVGWKAVKKLLKIPNTYASFLGLIWSLVAFKFGIKMPKIIDDSLFIIYTTAVGLSMFSSGTFIARQSRFVPCGYTVASLSMVLKFLIGPVIMLLASFAIGLHGTLLHIAVVQAALPLAVTSFVYAEEYKVHADIMSTGVILGIFISLPVTIVYYIVLGL